jgi:threonine/homoserine/homoserine lactone efflux protein
MSGLKFHTRMNISLFLRSILIGFSIAAPVGPIGILCIRRSLMEGRLIGLISGLGAASADGVYGCLAGLGISLVSGFLIAQANWIRLAGGLFLAYLGISAMLSRPTEQAGSVPRVSFVGAYTSTFFLTLSNPIPILSFAAIFTGLGANIGGSDFRSVASVVLGIFTGSASWWLFLSSGVSLARSRITPAIMRWVNRISGLAILGFAIVVLASIRF